MAYSMRHHLVQPEDPDTNSPVWFNHFPELHQPTAARHLEDLLKQLSFAESQVADRETQNAILAAQLTERELQNATLETQLTELQQAQATQQAQVIALQTQLDQRHALDAERQAVFAQDCTQIADLQRQLRAVMPPDCSGEWGVHRQRGRWPVQTYTRPKQLALISSRWFTRVLLGLGLAVIISWGWSLLLGMGPVEAMVTLVPKLVVPIGTLLLGVWIWATVAEG
jgi:hypothetical protein